jgi:hypothetical protein
MNARPYANRPLGRATETLPEWFATSEDPRTCGRDQSLFAADCRALRGGFRAPSGCGTLRLFTVKMA